MKHFGLLYVQEGGDFMINDEEILSELNNNHLTKFDNIVFTRDGGSLSYIVYSNEQRFFLKIIRPEFLDTALQSVDIQLYLYHNEIPVPKIIFTKDDKPYISVEYENGKHLYILYEYVEGHEPDINKDAEKIGCLIGKFHRTMQNYTGELVTRNKSYFIDRYIEILRRKNYPNEKLKTYIEYGHFLWEQVKSLPYGYCHGDLNRGNLHQTPEGDLYLLDFDTSCRAFPMYDIMMVCNCTDYFNYDSNGFKETREIFDSFLTGYLQQHTLSKSEWFAFNDLVSILHYQLQATIIEIYGLDCVDEKFIDNQLNWLLKWKKQSQVKLNIPERVENLLK
jgi:Ser/Thr protein kinase RdoA (MazF antagonist)